MKIISLIILLLGLAFNMKAQTEDALQYYPMAVGNYWYYSQPLGNGYWLKVVKDSSDQIGNKYFFLKGTMYYRLCLDKNGYLWENSYKLYKLDAEKGEKWWAIGDGIDTTRGMWGTVENVLDIIYLGKQTRIKIYAFYGRTISNGQIKDYYRYGVTLAYGLGMIYKDNDANPPYILEGAIINGEIIGNPVGVKEPDLSLPTSFSLAQNFPNPFNPETTISFSIPKSEHVTLKIYDVLGREVATIVDEFKQAGMYKTDFNASGLVSGVYFYQLSSGTYVETKKLILMK